MTVEASNRKYYGEYGGMSVGGWCRSAYAPLMEGGWYEEKMGKAGELSVSYIKERVEFEFTSVGVSTRGHITSEDAYNIGKFLVEEYEARRTLPEPTNQQED